MASFLEHLPKQLQNVKIHELVDFTQPSLYLSIASIIFNPTVWNIVARNEHHNRTMTKFLGSPKKACYLMAVTIVGFGLLRDALFENALRHQPKSVPDHPYLKPIAAAIFVVGQILVLSSTWALGVTGTYLGDYCGILQDKMVTGFPFNLLKDPMYDGSTMCFLATALWYRRHAGFLVTIIVWIVYSIALKYEGPFTAKIYADRDAKNFSSAASKSSNSKSSPAKASTPAKSASATPKKKAASSGGIAAFKPATPAGTVDTETESYADAIKIGVSPATPPKKSTGVTSAKENGGGTPARMTRSRSKARGSEDEL